MTKKLLLLSLALLFMSGIVLGMEKRPIMSVFEGVDLYGKRYVEVSLVKTFPCNKSCFYGLQSFPDGREEHCVLPSSDFVRRKFGAKEGTFVPWDLKGRMKRAILCFKKSRRQCSEDV